MSNAKTKRLNESFRPVTNYGTADDFHKLIVPQNTTDNLALINPKDVGSIAYDTTQGALVVQTGSGFSPIGGSPSATTVNLLNNESTPTNVPGLIFSTSITSPVSLSIYTYMLTTGSGAIEGTSLATWVVIYLPVTNTWYMALPGTSFDYPTEYDPSFNLTITTSGQVQYTTGDITAGGSQGTFAAYTMTYQTIL